MTIKEMLEWVNRAEEFKENSWGSNKNKYKFNEFQSLIKTKPVNLNVQKVEQDIAYFLIRLAWNEVQIWVNKIV